MSFKEIPLLDLSLASDPATKPAFLADLRHALLEVGFLYLKNVGISDELFAKVISEGKAFFDIPPEEKLKIEMKNAPSFLGYSQLSAEITAGAVDHREQIDREHPLFPSIGKAARTISMSRTNMKSQRKEHEKSEKKTTADTGGKKVSTEHPVPGPDAPLHHNLLAPNQWPSPGVLPGFRPAFAEYMASMGRISIAFTSLIAEAIGLPAGAFDRYFDAGRRQQHKLKVVRYPDAAELGLADRDGQRQGVGPHKDSMLTSYLLQASAHRGLQVQNTRGEWIDCPPQDGTLVVAIGQGMEALTGGVCCSTTHRVLSPAAGSGSRFSIPFFQGVRGDATFDELETVGVGEVPADVRAQRRAVLERAGGRPDDVEFTFRSGASSARTLGEATLRNRVKSHQDVGERWYPELLQDVRAQLAREKREKEERAAADVDAGGR